MTGACACGSGRPYAGCCEPFHAGDEPPDATAIETLPLADAVPEPEPH